jgi:GTP-binding protein
MVIKNVDYFASYHKQDICPNDGKPEFAFIGRSNVGKSSLINMLIDRKDLARVSKEPGKTQSLNYYIVNNEWYLVDLPGYGYAKTSKKMRENWSKMIKDYLEVRNTLVTSFVLIDSRHTLQKIDKEFLEWCGEKGVPFNIIYTKADKNKQQELQKNIEAIENELLETWEELPTRFISSAEDRRGKEDILGFIGDLLINF